MIKQEIIDALGAGSEDPNNLLAPDGTFKPQLRTTVYNTLLESKFDNVATLLSEPGWADQNKEDLFDKQSVQFAPVSKPRLIPQKTITPGMSAIAEKLDVSRKPFVSILKKEVLGKPATAGAGTVGEDSQVVSPLKRARTTAGGTEGIGQLASELTLCDIAYPGLEETAGSVSVPGSPMNGNQFSKGFDPTTMCFGCWSAGVKRKCTIHEDSGSKIKPSQTMLLGVMRRRYRSEEIQEIFLKKSTSLRYDAKRKKFSTVAEQRHPVYRTLSHLTAKFNSTILVFIKVRRWLHSMADVVCSGKLRTARAAEKALEMKDKRSYLNQCRLNGYAKRVAGYLPLAPVRPGRQRLLHSDLLLRGQCDREEGRGRPPQPFLRSGGTHRLAGETRWIPLPVQHEECPDADQRGHTHEGAGVTAEDQTAPTLQY